MDEDTLAGVVVIDDAVPIPYVNPFNGSRKSSIFVSGQVDKAVLYLLTSRGLSVLSQGVVIRQFLPRNGLDELAPRDLHISQ